MSDLKHRMLWGLIVPANLLLSACSGGASLGNDGGAGGMDATAGSGDALAGNGGTGGIERPTFGGSQGAGRPGTGASSGSNTGGSEGIAGSVGVGGAGPVRCFETERTDEDDRVNAEALDATTHARPGAVARLIVRLTEPGFDFTRLQNATGAERDAIIAERQAQVAVYQDPIETLLGQYGAESIESMWLVNMVSAAVPAEHVEKMLCWPEVVRIELQVGYWEIVDPPWSEEEAGPGRCPIVDGACPEHCIPLNAHPYDGARQCLEPPEIFECLYETKAAFPGVVECAANVATDEVYVFPIPLAPGAPDYRECTPDESSAAFRAQSCP